MTLQKAIEILANPHYHTSYPPSPDQFDALNLAIQALRRITALRIRLPDILSKPLPDETDDNTI